MNLNVHPGAVIPVFGMHLQTLWLAFELMLQWVGVCVFGGQNVEGELHIYAMG